MALSERRAGEVFYRYMGVAERKVVEDTNMLRGGRGAGTEETYWTDEAFGSATEAQARLALRGVPRVRLAFTITNDPELLLEGARVRPDEGQPGGGTEWMSRDAVEVEVIGYVDLDD